MVARPLRRAPTDLEEIVKQEEALVLPHFTADDAFEIGMSIRNRLREISPLTAVVNISLTNDNNLLFHAASRSGVVPEGERWVSRKRKTVARWGKSSWYMHHMMKGDDDAFKTRWLLGETAYEYAIYGGGVPVRVKGVEGVVGVVVVSGLASEEDHQVIVEALGEYVERLERGAGSS